MEQVDYKYRVVPTAVRRVTSEQNTLGCAKYNREYLFMMLFSKLVNDMSHAPFFWHLVNFRKTRQTLNFTWSYMAFTNYFMPNVAYLERDTLVDFI